MRLKTGHGGRRVGLRRLHFVQPVEKYQNVVSEEDLRSSDSQNKSWFQKSCQVQKTRSTHEKSINLCFFLLKAYGQKFSQQSASG